MEVEKAQPKTFDEASMERSKSFVTELQILRIKDPKVSLDFYSRLMGMSLLKRFDFPEMKFTLYFLGYEDTSLAPTDPVERTSWTFGQKAVLELTYNWGTESDPDFKGYHNGNSEPRGFDFRGSDKVLVEKVDLIRPNDEMHFLEDAIGSTVVWLSKFIVL